MKIVICSGGFDPLHSGHIKMFNHASEFGKVVVGLNSDDWLTRKKGKPFMNSEERNWVVSNIKSVFLTYQNYDDSDNSSCDLIRKARADFPNAEIAYANGGDRTKANVPEQAICDELNVKLLWEIGGNYKANSSSSILKNWDS